MPKALHYNAALYTYFLNIPENLEPLLVPETAYITCTVILTCTRQSV